MKRHTLLFALLTLLVVLAGVAGQAHAYSVLKTWGGETKRWSKSTVPWTVQAKAPAGLTFAEFQGAIDDAFDAWQALSCATIGFAYSGTASYDPGNGVHVRIQTNSWDPSVGDALAYASPDTNSSGTILSSPIVFNGVEPTWSVAASGPFGTVDVQAVATHEIGHAIGLDHSRHMEATMWFQGGGVDDRTLDPDDIHGACFL